MIKQIIEYFKRPKCKCGYRCPDCVHHEYLWENEIFFRGIKCRINAR